MGLTDYIESSEIKLYDALNKELDTNVSSLGEYNWNLVNHLTSQSNEIVFEGKGLYDFLTETKNIFELSDFIIQLWSRSVGGKYHVNASIDELNKKFPQEKLYIGSPINLETTFKDDSNEKLPRENSCVVEPIDVTNWISSLNHFERVWNLSLCNAIGGFVGYPGYEWPQNENEFKVAIAEHAQQFLFGSNNELDRYNEISKFLQDDESEQGVLDTIKLFRK